MNAPLRGRKGSGKGGGGSRTPYEAPDNLLADSTAYIIDLVSEGEIEGWADPEHPAKCIYFDDVPLQNPDGSFNYSGVEYWLRTGTPDQDPVPGFSAVESEINVALQVTQAQPVARTITESDIDAVRVKVGVTALSTLNAETGDVTGARVDFAIEMQSGAGGWEEVGTYSISGKTTSGYQKAYRVELPDIRPVSIRVRRITADSTSSRLQNDLYFASYTEIIDAKLCYPDTAYVALAIPAQAFGGRVPRRSYRLKLIKCWVPSNYDPETRVYDESTIWDGTFKLAWTDNPAFFTYTVFQQDRWGLGARIPAGLTDKWRIYQIGKYCDELVDDGFGGQEPRFTMNGVMNTREGAYQVVTQLSAVFRGVTYWGAGGIVPVQDAPGEPIKVVTNANVVGGEFNYSGTGLPARKTAVVASYRDVNDHHRIKAGVAFEDPEKSLRYGRRPTDVTLPFETRPGGALRACRWIVDTNTTQRETVNWQGGLDHAGLRPGDRVFVSDKHRVGYRLGGRLLSISGDRLSITLDAPVLMQDGQTHTAFLANELGNVSQVDVVSSNADAEDMATVLTLDAPLAADFRAGAVFSVAASNLPPRRFNVLSNTPDKHVFNIVAVEDDPNKHARVEQGIKVDEDAPYILPNAGKPDAPGNVSVDVFYREVPSGLVASVSWEQPTNASVANYRLELTDSSGVRSHVRDLAAQSFDIPLTGAETGTLTAHVAAQNHVELWSEFASVQFSVQDAVRIPDIVEEFRIRILGDQAQLTWKKGKPSVSHYHIKHLPPGASGGWTEAQDVETDIPGRTATVPALPGKYLIKAFSIFGEASPEPAIIDSTIVELVGYNVVREVALHPNFAGDLSPGLYRTDDGLQLLGADTWADWPTWAEVGIWAKQGEIADSAIFTSSEVTDLGAVMTSRVTTSLDGRGYNQGLRWSDWGLWSEIGNWAGVVDDQWRIRLQISITSDDPADAMAVWSDWQDFLVGDYLARGFRFRVIFESLEQDVTALLRALSVQIDVPDRILEGADVICPAEGIYVPFAPPFLEKPAIAVDGQGLPVGVRSVRTQHDRAGFHQQYVDDQGQGVPCTFDFIAKGYGRLI